MRVTAPRRAVYAAFGEGRAHLDADMVAKRARTDQPGLSTQAIYDTLHMFVELGLLRRIQPAGHPARYERRVGDNHHHLICRSCGKTEDIDCVVGAAPCLEPIETFGYRVEEAEVIFWGTCERCRTLEEK
jgi:Fur family ferric uptake transcriptional regulator